MAIGPEPGPIRTGLSSQFECHTNTNNTVVCWAKAMVPAGGVQGGSVAPKSSISTVVTPQGVGAHVAKVLCLLLLCCLVPTPCPMTLGFGSFG